MAFATSIGLHFPSGLDHLISDGLLPRNPARDLYKWQTYYDGLDPHGEEELLSTNSCVLWSQNRVVRRLFRFDVEKEKVAQALLTWFDEAEGDFTSKGRETPEFQKATFQPSGGDVTKSARAKLPAETVTSARHSNVENADLVHFHRSRALVVILQQQAHVYYLNGSSYIIHLPFEVEHAFATPKGLLLQKRRLMEGHIQSTPMPPMVPFNSFAPSQSFRFPPFVQSGPVENEKGRKISWGMSKLPKSLADLALGSKPAVADRAPHLFSLTDPVSEMGLVIEDASPSRPDDTFLNGSASHVTQQLLDKDEEVVYVSAIDELCSRRSDSNPLIVVLTMSRERKTYSIWHASYGTHSSLSAMSNSRQRRATSPSIKLRNSMAARQSLTAPTPTVSKKRSGRDSLNRSFTGHTSFTALNAIDNNQEPLSIDAPPEHNIESSFDVAFESPGKADGSNRRTSSILARAELSTHDQTSFSRQSALTGSFGAPSRRTHSSGSFVEPSLNCVDPKFTIGGDGSRVSTLKTPRRDDIEMTTSTIEEENDELNSKIDDHAMGQLIPEFLMKRILTRPIGDPFLSNDVSMLPIEERVDIFTTSSASPDSSSNMTSESVRIFVINRERSVLSEIMLHVEKIPNTFGKVRTNHESRRPYVRDFNIPASQIQFRVYRNVMDATKIIDGSYSGVIRLTRDTDGRDLVSLLPKWTDVPDLRSKINASNMDVNTPKPIEILLPEFLRSTHPIYDTCQLHEGETTLMRRAPFSMFKAFVHAGSLGRIDMLDIDGRHHRFQVQLRPRDAYVREILATCSSALEFVPNAAEVFTSSWTIACQETLPSSSDREWIALVMTLLYFSSNLLRPNAAAEDDGTRTRVYGENTDEIKYESWGWLRNRSKEQREMTTSVVRLPSSEPYNDLDESAVNLTDLARCAVFARKMTSSQRFPHTEWLQHVANQSPVAAQRCVAYLLVALHMLREEEKLNVLSTEAIGQSNRQLGPVLAQLGHWLGWKSWSFMRDSYYDLDDEATRRTSFDPGTSISPRLAEPCFPPSIYNWIFQAVNYQIVPDFPTFSTLRTDIEGDSHSRGNGTGRSHHCFEPPNRRISGITNFLKKRCDFQISDQGSVEEFFRQHIDEAVLETMPEAIIVLLRTFAVRCQADPPTTWSKSLLNLIDRADLNKLQSDHTKDTHFGKIADLDCTGIKGLDARQLCADNNLQVPANGVDSPSEIITDLIYGRDSRFMEASTLLNSRLNALGEFLPPPNVSEAQFLDDQKAFAQDLFKRSMSLSAGEGLISFSTRKPLPTQKIDTPMFNTSCNIQPSNITIDVDKTPFGEDKAGWAYFHAGVAAGLYTSKDASTIDTSWLTLNKPAELGVRHAGLLMALGLNGHLKKMAKWLAFKYLTPKHDMTTIGLLLGLSASYFGTMDTLVTRLLSVHVPRLLPIGAAELNLSPLTQTAGIMGIGLLYCNTQHRRMSEVMLSELENIESMDGSHPSVSGGTSRRDEGYRLAVGFSMGLINLGKGYDTRNLHGLRVIERLLSIITGPREIGVVHVLDQATAGATIALALMFMKSRDEALARKLDVSSSNRQLDYTRPDILLLRTVAKSLIMWEDIAPTMDWLSSNLPQDIRNTTKPGNMFGLGEPLTNKNISFCNILAGLCWSISLKYAGTGSQDAIKLLLSLYRIVTVSLERTSSSHDSRLAQGSLQRFQNLLILSASTVASGTGDLDILRHLRAAHATVTPDCTFGFHQANHMALGALFLGHGRFAFGTSDLAVASLLCAFYPVFPRDAMDNAAHLQAFRHFWTFAAEARCLIARDVDTGEPIVTPVTVFLHDNTALELTLPHLLPETSRIARVVTTSPEYWRVTLDFERNPHHVVAFQKHQTIFLRKKSLTAQYRTPFDITMAMLSEDSANSTLKSTEEPSSFDTLFDLPIFGELGITRADALSVLPRGADDAFIESARHTQLKPTGQRQSPLTGLLDLRPTGIDDLLTLAAGVQSEDRDRLMGLKTLFTWADAEAAAGRRVEWIPAEGVQALKRKILERMTREAEMDNQGNEMMD